VIHPKPTFRSIRGHGQGDAARRFINVEDTDSTILAAHLAKNGDQAGATTMIEPIHCLTNLKYM
jgi:hypothetical protein